MNHYDQLFRKYYLDKKIREIDVARHLSVKKSKVLTNFLDISTILDRKIREINRNDDFLLISSMCLEF